MQGADWHNAINRLRNGGGGENITPKTLLETMKQDFFQNKMVNELLVEYTNIGSNNDEQILTRRLQPSITKEECLDFLRVDEIPTLFTKMDDFQFSGTALHLYNRLKKVYMAGGLKGVDLLDWKGQIQVFISSYLK